MKAFFLWSAWLLLCITDAHAQLLNSVNPEPRQHWCGTMEVYGPSTNEKQLSCAFLNDCYGTSPGADHDCLFNLPACTFRIPIQYHIVGTAAPAGINTTIDNETTILNTLYAPIGVEFFQCSPPNNVADPNGDNVYDLATEENPLITSHSVNGVINIYLVDAFANGGAPFAICGYAYLPTSGSQFLNNMFYSYQNAGCGFGTAQTSGHEIGHFLGLHHPHTDPPGAGTPQEDPTQNYCTQFGAGFGDGIEDTAPDPLLSDGNCAGCACPQVPGCPGNCYVDPCDCSYVGPAGYNPDLTNIMNYNPWAHCGGTDFTTCQLAKMSDILNTCKGVTLCGCMPDPVDPPDPAVICSNNAAGLNNLVATTTQGTPFSSECFHWWDQAAGGTHIATGANFTPPVPVDGSGCLVPGTYDYWVSNANAFAEDNGTQYCESNRMQFTITVQACGACVLACPTSDFVAGANEQLCDGGTPAYPVEGTDYNITDPDNTQLGAIQWFDGNDPTADNPVNTGDAVNHSGADQCATDAAATVFAFIQCDLDNNGTFSIPDGDSWVQVASHTYEVFAPAQQPTITADDNVCNYSITFICVGDGEGAGTSVDGSTESPGYAGNPTENVDVVTANGCTATFQVNKPACALLACPTSDFAAGANEQLCDGGTPAYPVEGTDYNITDPDNTQLGAIQWFDGNDPTADNPVNTGDAVNHSGADQCATDPAVTVFAFIQCDADNSGAFDLADGDSWVQVATHTYEVYAPAQQPTINADDNVCNYSITFICAGDAEGAGTSVDGSSETPGYAGNATENVDVVTANGCTATFQVNKPACSLLACPTSDFAAGANEQLCDGATPTYPVDGVDYTISDPDATQFGAVQWFDGNDPTVDNPVNTGDAVNHSAADPCATDPAVTVFAFIQCDADNSGVFDLAAGDSWVQVASHTYEVFAPASAPVINLDDNVCNYSITFACPGDAEGAGTTVDGSTEVPGYAGNPTESVDVVTANGCTATFQVDKPACPVPSCPQVVGVDVPVDACVVDATQQICFTFDNDPTGVVLDINGTAGVVDAVLNMVCVDVTLALADPCVPENLDFVVTALCPDGVAFVSDGVNSLNGFSIGTADVYPDQTQFDLGITPSAGCGLAPQVMDSTCPTLTSSGWAGGVPPADGCSTDGDPTNDPTTVSFDWVQTLPAWVASAPAACQPTDQSGSENVTGCENCTSCPAAPSAGGFCVDP